jgi:hypothetical protein
MSASNLPPIVKLAEQLLCDIERAFPTMKRVYRYPFGNDLRTAAARVVEIAQLAWHDRPNMAHWIERLDRAVRVLKTRLGTGCKLHAFASFAQFEALARQADNLGRQVGGWKRHHLTGRNGDRKTADRQRARTLSARAASHRGASV